MNCILSRAGSRHGQGWAKPTQTSVLPIPNQNVGKDSVTNFYDLCID